MKKKTVTSETEEFTIDNKKKRKKEKAYREIRWDRLDNTAHLFLWSQVRIWAMSTVSVWHWRSWCSLDVLQQALNIVLPKMDGFNLRLRMGYSGIILRRMESLHRKYVRRAIFRAVIFSRIKTTVICSAWLIINTELIWKCSTCWPMEWAALTFERVNLPVSASCAPGTEGEGGDSLNSGTSLNREDSF